MKFSDVTTWAKEHPVMLGVGVFAVGGLFLLLMSQGQGGGSNSSSGGQAGSDASAYYAAESADDQAGDNVQIAQINAQATTAQTQLNDAAYTSVQSTWASTQLQEQQGQNATAITLAPDTIASSLITALGQIASLPPTTTTTSKSSSGFLGIGSGKSTTTTTTANPSSVAATSALDELLSGYFPQNG
jgi:hypothetical protein